MTDIDLSTRAGAAYVWEWRNVAYIASLIRMLPPAMQVQAIKWLEEVRDEKIRPLHAHALKYKSQAAPYRRLIEKQWGKWRELQGVLAGKPSKADIASLRAKIISLARRMGFDFSKSTTTSVRGWHNISSGIKVSTDEYSDFVTVEYFYGALHKPGDVWLTDKRMKMQALALAVQAIASKVSMKADGLEFTASP